MVKNLPAMQETRLRFLGREDPLEEETATHPSILAWRIPWTEEPGAHSPWGHWDCSPTNAHRLLPGVAATATLQQASWLRVCVCVLIA